MIARNSKRSAPDFIIGGAQKAGTTTLHDILDSHNNISILPGELNFWSRDDSQEMPAFIPSASYRPERHFGEEDYHALFSQYPDNKILVGEDSTTYLSSKVATRNIAKNLPDVKIIFLLRNPIDRAYSHYWHQINQGRCFTSFEKWIKLDPNLIRRSKYGEHLAEYYKYFDESQIKIVIFEDFVQNRLKVVNDILSFLGVESINTTETLSFHSNRAQVRKSIFLHLLHNRIQCQILPKPMYRFSKLVSKLHNYVNPVITHKSYPLMLSDTRLIMTDIFYEDVLKLSQLLGEDELLPKWGFVNV